MRPYSICFSHQTSAQARNKPTSHQLGCRWCSLTRVVTHRYPENVDHISRYTSLFIQGNRQHVSACVYIYICMDGWMYGCMSVCLYVCMSVCMYVCMSVCLCIYIYMTQSSLLQSPVFFCKGPGESHVCSAHAEQMKHTAKRIKAMSVAIQMHSVTMKRLGH